METEPVKDRLKALTKEAVDEGAFGMPYIVVYDHQREPHYFFGCDRFDAIASQFGEQSQRFIHSFIGS